MEGGNNGLKHAERVDDILTKRCSNKTIDVCDIGWVKVLISV